MSRAFVRESDDRFDDGLSFVPPPALPPGAKNYLTSDGATRLRAELERLAQHLRPTTLAEANTNPEARAKLQKIDARIRYLTDSLNRAEVIDPATLDTDRVRFGSIVTVRHADGAEETWRIVGVDETDLDRGWVSWVSPLARALLQAKAGEAVPFRGKSLVVVRIER